MKTLCLVGTLALILGGAPTTGSAAELATGQPPEPPITGRIEIVPHEFCFTVRFYLENHGSQDVRIEYGQGHEGLTNVPNFYLTLDNSASMTISPPVYRWPQFRHMRPDIKIVPAKKETLYGEFTMGWPTGFDDRHHEGKMYANSSFNKEVFRVGQRYSIRTPEVPFVMTGSDRDHSSNFSNTSRYGVSP